MNRPLNQHDCYRSPANLELILRIAHYSVSRVLDIGAGTGGNITALKLQQPEAECVALTCSPLEAQALEGTADQTVVADLNSLTTVQDWQNIGISPGDFDLVILSHVLEHLIDPGQILSGVSQLLRPKGLLLIALPNICHWRTRLRIARGQFVYQDAGTLDRSHLRFYTYWTARELIETTETLSVIQQWPVGGAILGPARSVLPRKVCRWIDQQAIKHWPNLFGFEAQLLAQRCS